MEDLKECFVCTETSPVPWRSACLCTDRYIHKNCQCALINKSGSTACPACGGTYTNIRTTKYTRLNMYSKPVVMWFLCGMLFFLSGCGVNTAIHLALGKNVSTTEPKETTIPLTIATALFLSLSCLGWIWWGIMVRIFGSEILFGACMSTVTTHSLVLPTVPV